MSDEFTEWCRDSSNAELEGESTCRVDDGPDIHVEAGDVVIVSKGETNLLADPDFDRAPYGDLYDMDEELDGKDQYSMPGAWESFMGDDDVLVIRGRDSMTAIGSGSGL